DGDVRTACAPAPSRGRAGYAIPSPSPPRGVHRSFARSVIAGLDPPRAVIGASSRLVADEIRVPVDTGHLEPRVPPGPLRVPPALVDRPRPRPAVHGD